MLRCSKRDGTLFEPLLRQGEFMFMIYILSKIRSLKLDRQT